MAKTFDYPNGAFTLSLPDDWDYAVKNASIAFFQPETGFGAINVSALAPTKGARDPAKIALQFTPGTLRAGLQVTNFECSVPAANVEYEIDGNAWRLWTFCGRTRVVVVTYNCRVHSKGKEDRTVDQIVQSLIVS